MKDHHPDAEAAIRSLGSVFAESLRKCGGWTGCARRMAVTLISGFALFMPPVALYELSRVKAVHGWPMVELELLGVEKVDNRNRRGGTAWIWSFREPSSGRIVETRDFEPGDLPTSGPGWSTIDRQAEAWQRLVGQRVEVWMSPDGKEVYPSQGTPATMTGVLVLSGLWWTAFGLKWLRGRRVR